jgi:catechol-2,3-dioxygenase
VAYLCLVRCDPERYIFPEMKLTGVELYFDDLDRARSFYRDTLGLNVIEDDIGHHIKVSTGDAFLCMERKGVETYPSPEKAVLFFDVPSLRDLADRLDPSIILQRGSRAGRPWLAVRDPEGHTVLFLEGKHENQGASHPHA